MTLIVKRRRCVVVGGGSAAARKVDLILSAGGDVVVVAPGLVAELQRLAAAGRIRHMARAFAPRDLAGAALAVAAADDRGTNATVAAAAQNRGVPINVVDNPALSTITMPAIIERGPVSVAIATGGASPTLARRLRLSIARALPPGIDALAEFAAAHRRAVKRALPDAETRRRFWDTILEGPAAAHAMAGQVGEAGALLRAELVRAAAAPPQGRVYLVGAGPGDPELLTLKALRLLETTDVIVHDHLVSAQVLALARREAERISVGKRCGRPSARQSEINTLLVSLARAGKRAIRLKGGDPLIFGRGGEEMEALLAAGVECEIVPGVTAALGCAAYAGIPLTHRDHAHSCVFVTGHLRAGSPDLDWPSLAAPLQTVCIYMGLRAIGRVVEGLVRHGRSPRTPAAIVVNGTTPAQRVLRGTLGELPQIARGCEAAGMVIVGEVVALRGRATRNRASPAGALLASS